MTPIQNLLGECKGGMPEPVDTFLFEVDALREQAAAVEGQPAPRVPRIQIVLGLTTMLLAATWLGSLAGV